MDTDKCNDGRRPTFCLTLDVLEESYHSIEKHREILYIYMRASM